MDGADNEVSDPSDWLKTSLSSLSTLDAALRCQVCKEFYDTPMITSCSHTFCSLCIRRCLSSDGKCPACRGEDQSSKLRRNWTVQECVDAFLKSRRQALELARNSGDDEHPKRKRRKRIGGSDNSQTTKSPPARRTRSSGKIGDQGMVPVSQEVIALDSDTDGDGDYQPREEEGPRHPNDGLVACPMCNKRMKEEAVYTHLDRCDGQKVKDTPPPMVHQPRPPNPPQQRISSPAKHLPHLNYSLLKDTALKKKLQELGIPTWGNRQLLVRRHTQWVDIFNANSDSPRSKNNRELLKELDVWERTQGGHAPGQGQTAPTGVMRKDFDGTEWTGRHKNQFEDLVTQARAKRKTTTPSTLEDNKQALDYMEGIVRTATASAENSKNDKSTPSSAALSNSDTAPKPMSALLSHELSSSPAASMLHSAAQDVRRRSSISDPSATANIPGLISTHSIPSTSSSTPAPSSHTRVLNDTRFSPTGSPEERKPPMNMATEDSLPEKLGLTTKGTKKISMFRVPEDPINDVELGAGTGGG